MEHKFNSSVLVLLHLLSNLISYGIAFPAGGLASVLYKDPSENALGNGGGGGNIADLMRDLTPMRMNFKENSTILDASAKDMNFVELLRKCAPIIKYCPLVSLMNPICPLACMLDQSRTAKHQVFSLIQTAKDLCYPINTVFDYGIGYLRQRNEETNQLSEFLSILNVDVDIFPIFGKSGATALPTLLIKYAEGPAFDKLKPVLASIRNNIAEGAQRTFQSGTQLTNPNCMNTDLSGPVQELVQQIIQNPAIADISIPGYFVLENIVHLRTNSFSSMFDTIRQVMAAMVGVECSLVQYGEIGSSTACIETVGSKFTKDLPANPKNAQRLTNEDLICGTEADIPDADLHSKFPDIFPKTKESDLAETFYANEKGDEFYVEDIDFEDDVFHDDTVGGGNLKTPEEGWCKSPDKPESIKTCRKNSMGKKPEGERWAKHGSDSCSKFMVNYDPAMSGDCKDNYQFNLDSCNIVCDKKKGSKKSGA